LCNLFPTLEAMDRIDWIIFFSYLVVVLAIGIWVSKKSKTGINSYFSADRSIPWWWLGISIIATTFAADTPLAITGITVKSGISGNWFWWSWVATYITVAIFFSKRWHLSGVLTDVELIELRYDGKQAAFLRGFKAFFFGIILNCFILGWVVTAAVKIASPFIDWTDILSVDTFSYISSIYPEYLRFKSDLNATLTIMALLILVSVYSSLGGIRGVILTDLFQFAIAILSAIYFAYYAVQSVGGISNMLDSIETIYGAQQAKYLLEFVPSFDNTMLPFQIFMIYILVQWWVRFDSDGTGYIAQRINTAKSPEDARKGTLLFSIGFVALRTWPWILVALVSLVLFPIDNPGANFPEYGILIGGDREMAYPLLMKLLLPAGLLGLAFTSLMAAFMSTVDTHLNWGASYMTNDIYLRFINKNADQKTLIRFGRIMVFVILIIAILVSSQIDSIQDAWKFFINAASGLGIAHLIRWFWWRANAYTELSAMLAALFATILAGYLKPENAGVHYESFVLLGITSFSFITAVIVTLCTKPVNNIQLQKFIDKTKPIGFWRGQSHSEGRDNLKNSIIQWIMGLTISYGSLFSIGYLLLQQYSKGIVALILVVIAFIWLQKSSDYNRAIGKVK